MQEIRCSHLPLLNFEIIGEASTMLTKELKEKNPDIPWHAVTGLRHVLVHGYYQISDTMIWNTITKDLKPFKKNIENIQKKM